jgi:hypothetical protein
VVTGSRPSDQLPRPQGWIIFERDRVDQTQFSHGAICFELVGEQAEIIIIIRLQLTAARTRDVPSPLYQDTPRKPDVFLASSLSAAAFVTQDPPNPITTSSLVRTGVLDNSLRELDGVGTQKTRRSAESGRQSAPKR